MMSWFKKRTTKAVSELPTIPVIQTMPTELELDPFPHVHIQNFFKEDFYRQICNQFKTVLATGIVEAHEPWSPNKFHKIPYGYDAAYWQPPPDVGLPIKQLFQSVWIDFFSSMFGVPLTKNISLTFHCQLKDSKPFAAHNDYCYVGMPKLEDQDDRVRQFYFENPYFITGSQEAREMDVSLQMRSVVGLFYLENPKYLAGNGGETGLYRSYEDYTQDNPVKKIPPLSNSMLIFETTPHSFHTYLPNKAKYRNTMLFWLHSDAQLKIKRFKGALPVEYSYTRDYE